MSLIAVHFDLRIDTLLWANNLTIRDTISIGDKLKILPIDGIRYIVKEGDTISSIAELYQSATEDIIEFNDLERNGFIVKGQLLIIPDGKPAPKVISRTFPDPAPPTLISKRWPEPVLVSAISHKSKLPDES